ncbi:hypothetical protein [Streptomyces rubellomurinus]|uniref:SIS domain-containing protein n=1 Tax=Streptomyces rubellomurinus (strain ATCC 31215) TaxID=359131 RepID=A0A0F2TB18_STRR3|nr:hypothetical protein [Streptomyces rubellomurinus]KJS60404.1 hypothetical protein VM95_21435 [Streptomyces rubellomurinus]
MDAVRVAAIREQLTGTGWLEAVGGFAGSLRRSVERRGAGDLLLVGTEAYEPWHLAAHLEDEAAWSAVPRLAPTLLRHRPPAGAPAHLGHGLRRLAEAGRGATVLVVAPEAAGGPLLERVRDARRHGATVLALDGAAQAPSGDLAGLAHERLVVGTAAEEPFDLAQHLVSAAAGQRPTRRSALGRLADLAGRLAAPPPISRW